MDWAYKRFNVETVFQSPRNEVFEAARAFVADSLGWQVLDTAEGFEARGSSFAHAATAKFCIEPAMGGTKVAVELFVERASPMGFLLFDLGSYYNRQVHNWFEGIQWALHNRLASPTAPSSSSGESGTGPTSSVPTAPATNPKSSQNAAFKNVFGCIVILWIIILLMSFFIFPSIGLLTGHLYIPGRGSGGVTIHGPWARAISAVTLMIGAFIVWKLRRIRVSGKPLR
jgi:hypothetical protein